ncbi:MAG: tetratricopeptide repeat protein, partial [Pirellulales bacterium]
MRFYSQASSPSQSSCYLIAVCSFLVAACCNVSSLSGDPPSSWDDAPTETLSKEQRQELVAERDRLWEEARGLLKQGKLPAAIDAAEAMLEIERRVLGNYDLEVAISLGWLAERYLAIEDFDSAREARQERVEILAEIHGKQDWRVADARWELAHVTVLANLSKDDREALAGTSSLQREMSAAHDRSDIPAAVELARKVLARRQMLLPDPHPDLSLSLNDLGYFLDLQGDFAEAKEYYEQSLAMDQRLYPTEEYPNGHPDLAISLSKLGSLLISQGDFAAAMDYYEQVLAMRKRLYSTEEYPDGHSDVALSLNNLGYLLESQGDLVAARDYTEQALAMYQRLYPTEAYPNGHGDLATSLNNLGSLLVSMGDLASARGYHEQALAMRRRLYPTEEYPNGYGDLALSLNNLGHLLDL